MPFRKSIGCTVRKMRIWGVIWIIYFLPKMLCHLQQIKIDLSPDTHFHLQSAGFLHLYDALGFKQTLTAT